MFLDSIGFISFTRILRSVKHNVDNYICLNFVL